MCRMLSQEQHFRRVQSVAWLAAVGSRPVYVEIFARCLFNGVGLVLMRGLCGVCVCVCLNLTGGFPGDSVVKNPPANVGDTGLILDLGRSHMLQSSQARTPQLLSPRAVTTEACKALQPCSTTREATAVRSLNTARKGS